MCRCEAEGILEAAADRAFICGEYTTDFNRWYLSFSLWEPIFPSMKTGRMKSRRLRLKLKHDTTGSRWYLQGLLSVLIAPAPQYTDAKRLTSRQRVSILSRNP